MKETMHYPAIFTPCMEMAGYTVTFPDLPGCVTEGASLEQAMAMAQDAAYGWLLGEWEEGKELPAPTSLECLVVEANSFVEMIEIIGWDG